MKKLLARFCNLIGVAAIALALASCKTETATEPEYIVQVSLGGWHKPDYTAEQIIGRIDTVSNLIPVSKVIIGWSLDEDIYREVGAYLHSKDIKMLIWLPVFAETEEMCENSLAVDLWGKVPSGKGETLADKILYEAGVFITPGFIFGKNGEDYIRISLCAKPEVLGTAAERIRQIFEEDRFA